MMDYEQPTTGGEGGGGRGSIHLLEEQIHLCIQVNGLVIFIIYDNLKKKILI